MKTKTLREPMPAEPDPEGHKAPKGFAPAATLEDSERIRQPFVELMRLKQMVEDQEDQVKQTKQVLAEKTKECVDILEAHGLQNARMAGIGLVYVSLKDHCSVPVAQKEAMMEELKRRGFEDLIKTEPTVHNGTLASLVKELREGGEQPLDTVTVFTEKKIVVRK